MKNNRLLVSKPTYYFEILHRHLCILQVCPSIYSKARGDNRRWRKQSLQCSLIYKAHITSLGWQPASLSYTIWKGANTRLIQNLLEIRILLPWKTDSPDRGYNTLSDPPGKLLSSPVKSQASSPPHKNPTHTYFPHNAGRTRWILFKMFFN